MDYTKEPQRVLSFCTGCGGIELGLKGAGMDVQPVAYCENEEFACWNVVNKIEKGLMASAPIWTDLKTFPMEQFRGRVDGIIGGYPCQPFSQNSKRKGEADPRHLWPFIQGAVAVIRPRWCFFENVIGHLTCGFKNISHDLGELGYIFTAGIFSAEEVGLPQRRKRLFILAHRDDCGSRQDQQPTKLRSARVEQSPGGAGDDNFQTKIKERQEGSSKDAVPARPGQPQHWWEAPRVLKSEMDRTTPWSSSGMVPAELWETYKSLAVSCDNRASELRLLGNTVCPQTCTKAFMTLWDELTA